MKWPEWFKRTLSALLGIGLLGLSGAIVYFGNADSSVEISIGIEFTVLAFVGGVFFLLAGLYPKALGLEESSD